MRALLFFSAAVTGCALLSGGCAPVESKIQRDAVVRVYAEGQKNMAPQPEYTRPHPYVMGISREGREYFVRVTLAGDEMFPRRYLLVYDYKGNFLSIQREKSLYEESDDEMKRVLNGAWAPQQP